MNATHDEGVIKYTLDFSHAAPVPASDISGLSELRQKLWRLGLIGQSECRYGGIGYGNISRRQAVGSNNFLVSGTQTGAIEWLGPQHYSLVTGFDINANRLSATGPVEPSSEAMTHGVLYELDPHINVIVHVHAPAIWHHALIAGWPVTRAGVSYGTPAMAAEVARLFTSTTAPVCRLFVMGGHQDGVFVFADTLQRAETTILQTYAESMQNT